MLLKLKIIIYGQINILLKNFYFFFKIMIFVKILVLHKQRSITTVVLQFWFYFSSWFYAKISHDIIVQHNKYCYVYKKVKTLNKISRKVILTKVYLVKKLLW